MFSKIKYSGGRDKNVFITAVGLVHITKIFTCLSINSVYPLGQKLLFGFNDNIFNNRFYPEISKFFLIEETQSTFLTFDTVLLNFPKTGIFISSA